MEGRLRQVIARSRTCLAYSKLQITPHFRRNFQMRLCRFMSSTSEISPHTHTQIENHIRKETGISDIPNVVIIQIYYRSTPIYRGRYTNRLLIPASEGQRWRPYQNTYYRHQILFRQDPTWNSYRQSLCRHQKLSPARYLPFDHWHIRRGGKKFKRIHSNMNTIQYCRCHWCN